MIINSESLDISVIVRTKNSESTIEYCLSSLCEQKLDSLEIIIVDSGSTDKTKEIVSSYPHKWISYPENKPFNYAHAINIGIAQASKKYILILSSHAHLLQKDTVQWMTFFLQRSSFIKAVSLGRTDNLTESKDRLSFLDIKWKIISKTNFRGQGMYNYCALVRKSDVIKNPFDTNMPTCEDQKWIKDQINRNNSGAVILHYPLVYYKNPYYNLNKDIKEHLVIAQMIHPYYRSLSFIRHQYRIGIKAMSRFYFKKAIHRFILGSVLLVNKIFPKDVGKFKSVYNKALD